MDTCLVPSVLCYKMYSLAFGFEALTRIEDETAVPVPLVDLQKLLDPERRPEMPC